MAEENKPNTLGEGRPGKKFSFRLKFPGRNRKPFSSAKQKKSGKAAPKDEKYIKSISEIFREFKEKELGKERFAVMGMGNDLKGDDGVGFYVADRLGKEFAGDGSLLFIKTSVPENHVKQIREFAPSLLIIVDAADFGKRPGSIKVIKGYQISGSFISTHTTPLTLFLKLYQADQPVKSAVTIIGIQRKSSDFGRPMSGPVRKAGDAIAETVSALYRKGLLNVSLEKEIARASNPFRRIAGGLRKSKTEKGKGALQPTS